MAKNREEVEISERFTREKVKVNQLGSRILTDI
jgi:hypothetical protein